jgi:hypothetical protein
MSVTTQTPYKKYTAAPGGTVFGTGFRLLLASDLVVKVNGVILATGFSISSLGAGNGSDVTFAAPMVGGEIIELRRVVPKSRTVDYQQLGDYQAKQVNNDFDRAVMMVQDNSFAASLALQVDPANSDVNTVLPTPIPLNVWGWDATGKKVVQFPSTSLAATEIATTAAAAAASSAAASASSAATSAASATSAAASATAGADSAAYAASAKTAAEAARDAAAVNAAVYSSVATGLSAVADGAQFQVVAADGLSIARYRRDAGPVATLLATFPTKSGVDFIQSAKPTVDDWFELVIDSSGRPVRGQKHDGTLWEARGGTLVQVAQAPVVQGGTPQMATLAVTTRLSAPGVDTFVPTIGDWSVLELDATGRPVYGETFSGLIYKAKAGALAISSGGSDAAPHTYAYDHLTGTAVIADALTDYLVIINGQSWAVGGYAGDAGEATVTTAPQHPGYALMLNAGVRPSGATVSSFVDLYEQNQGGSYESPASGMADIIMSGLQSRIGSKPRIVFCSASLGGQAYFDARDPAYGLKRGSATYAEGLRLVTRAKEISAAAGRKLIVLAQVVIHGEQDFTNGTPKAMYQRALDQWQMHFDQDARAITGQLDPVRMYVTQVNRGGSSIGSPSPQALAQLAAEDSNPAIRCVGAVYQGPSGSDGSHLRAVGYRMLGRLVGKFILEDLYGPYEQPLRVVDAWWVSSTVARLKYSKSIAVETGDTLVVTSTLGADKGVKFTDGTGSPPAVSGVAVVSGATDTLEVTLAAAPTGKNPRLTVAAYRPGGTGSGATNGARSGIRSSTAIDTDALTGITQYHWACQEQIILPTI